MINGQRAALASTDRVSSTRQETHRRGEAADGRVPRVAAFLDPFAVPPAPDELPRVLGRADALARGFSPSAIDRRLASGRWRRLLPRTYLTRDTLTTWDRMNAALVFAGSGAVLSGAAALYASEVPRILAPERVLVLVPPANRSRSAGWAQVRRSFRPFEREPWYGPPRVRLARAAPDHALSLDRLDDVRALVARVARTGRCPIADLRAELDAGPRNGSAFLRQAIEEVSAGAASAPEARAATILRRGGAPPFEQNVRIDLAGSGYYVADLYWRGLRAVLEIDSREHHLDPADWERTMTRHLALETLGLSVVHRPPSALRNERRFLADILGWLTARRDQLARNLG